MLIETRIQGMSQDGFEKRVQKHLEGDPSVCQKVRKAFSEVAVGFDLHIEGG